MVKPINPHQKQFFDERAERWDDIVTHVGSKIRYLLQFVNLKEGSQVLDVGTGTGILIPFLNEIVGSSGRIIAVDYSENMIEVASCKHPRDLYQNTTFIAQDINDYPIKPVFDAVICFSCFPHFVDQNATLAHLVKGLKKKGILMISHENSRDYINNLHSNAGKEVAHDFLPTLSTLKKNLEELGLTITDTQNDEEFFFICGEKQ